MEGSSPASAAGHLAAVPNHAFLMDFGTLPEPTPLRDLLAHVQPDHLEGLGSASLASHHQRSGMTTRSLTFQRQSRYQAQRQSLPLRDTPQPVYASPQPSFGSPSVAASMASFSSEAVVASAVQETRKRRATAAKSTGSPPNKRRRTQASPKASNLKKAPPGSETPVKRDKSPAGLKNDCDYGEESSQPSCCICMCEPEPADVSTINGCQHKFCFDCIEKWADRENTCPLCKSRFSKIERVNKAKRKKGEPSRKGSKHVKMRDQRSIPESALEGLVASFSAAGSAFPPHSIARLLFAGMGSGFIDFGPTRLVRARELHFDNGPRPIVFGPRSEMFDDAVISSDDDSEGISGFLNQMRRVHARSVRLAAPNPQRFAAAAAIAQPPAAAVMAAAAAAAARSYALNMNESTAGNAHNPLEIEDDSDDDDDDEVEVVEVVTRVE